MKPRRGDMRTNLRSSTRSSTLGLTLSPWDLLSYLKNIEVVIGRQPTFRYGPRIIDLDILFYDRLVLDTPQLTIPHPRLGERTFVLVPLADLDPDLRHPVTGETVREMLARLDTRDIRPI